MPQVILMCGQKELERWSVADGTSLHGIMLARNPDTGNWPAPTICIHAGQPVLRKDWPEIFLHRDDVVVFVRLPLGGGGGGSNPLQIILTVALVAASIAAPYLAPEAWGLVTAAGVVTWQGHMLSAGIMMAGSLIMSQAFSRPTGMLPAMQAEQASPTYSLNGSGNQARMGQVVPEGFGKMLVVPDVIAQEWAQYINNEMYLYQVFGCGRGTYEHHELSFGDVVFWRDGRIIESAYSTESGDQYTNKLDKELAQVMDGGDWTEPARAVGEGENARTISITLSFPDGLYAWKFQGVSEDQETGQTSPDWKLIPAEAVVAIEYREIGTSDWILLTRERISSPEKKGEIFPFFSNVSTDPFTKLIRAKTIGYGQWEIRARNESTVSEESEGTYNEGLFEQTYTKANGRKIVLQNVSSVSVPVYVQFVEAGDTVTLFPDNVEISPNVASQELIAPNADGHAAIGPFAVNSPGTEVTQILLGYIAPSGIGQYADNGSLYDYSVSITAEYQQIDDNGSALSGWKTLRNTTLTAGTLTAQRRTETCNVPSGRYQVRVRRTSNKRTDNRAVETVQWESMVGIIPGSLTYGQSAIAVKLKATNTLSQNAASNFKVLQTRKLPLYDRATGSWTEPQATRSFAAAMSQVVKAKWGGQLVDRQIDLDGLWRIGEELEARGWHFDFWLDGSYVVWSLITEMCEAYRIVPRAAGSVLSFVQDKGGRPVKHVFSPYDIVRGTFSVSWTTHSDTTPDDVLVSYLDETVGYVQRDVRAKLPESESRKTASHEYMGVVNRDHAHKAGLFRAACNRWRRLGCEFETEGVGRNLNLGDVVSITHPRFRNAANGRVEGWDEASLILQLDRDVQPAEDVISYLSLCRPDGSPWGPVRLLWVEEGMARFDPADYAALIMQGHGSPFQWLTTGADRVPTVWTLLDGRDFTRRYIIAGIVPQSLYRYKISCINDDSRVDSNDDMETPPWEYRGQLPTDTGLTAPENLRVSVTTTDLQKIVQALWDEVTGATGYEVQFGADGVNWTRYGQVNTSSVTLTLGMGSVWLRVAAVRGFEQSGWSIWH